MIFLTFGTSLHKQNTLVVHSKYSNLVWNIPQLIFFVENWLTYIDIIKKNVLFLEVEGSTPALPDSIQLRIRAVLLHTERKIKHFLEANCTNYPIMNHCNKVCFFCHFDIRKRQTGYYT